MVYINNEKLFDLKKEEKFYTNALRTVPKIPGRRTTGCISLHWPALIATSTHNTNKPTINLFIVNIKRQKKVNQSEKKKEPPNYMKLFIIWMS